MTRSKSKSTSKKKDRRPFPRFGLRKTLEVAEKIQHEGGGKPLNRLLLAEALGIKPSSSNYRDLLSSSFQYGLTDGTEKARQVSLAELGAKATESNNQSEKLTALRASLMKINVFREIFESYANKKLPSPEMLSKILATQYGVPAEHSKECAEQLIENGRFVEVIRDVTGSPHVMFDSTTSIDAVRNSDATVQYGISESDSSVVGEKSSSNPLPFDPANSITSTTASINRRVFVSHGKNKVFIEAIKRLLSFGELEPVVSVERHSVSIPVPEKVLSDMRSCGAAIIHVDQEHHGSSTVDGTDTPHLNANVLIEIGAAMALYGKRFVLLVREGAVLPSNLQGLFEVRYGDSGLDSDATIRLLHAIKDIKNHPLPS